MRALERSSGLTKRAILISVDYSRLLLATHQNQGFFSLALSYSFIYTNN